METATRLFSESGIGQTNLDFVATELGITRPALYHYFKGKDAILRACIAAGHFEWAKISEGLKSRGDLTPPDRLRYILVGSVDWARSLHGRFWAGIAMNELNEELRALKKAYHQERIEAFAQIVAEGMASGHFRYGNPEIAARMIWGCMFWHQYELDSPSFPRVVDETVDYIFSGLMRG